MPKIKFAARLLEASKGFVYLNLPPEAAARLGQRKRTPVVGRVNGFAIRTSVFPDGKGGFTMLVNKQMQAGAKAGPGDTVAVRLEIDPQPRAVELAADVKKALGKSRPAKTAFNKLPYSHQKEYIEYIDEAKKAETRARRIVQTVAMLEKLAGAPR